MSTSIESSKSLRYLWRCVYNYLTADTMLCSLVDHSSTQLRIYSGTPDQIAVYPCIVFWDEVTVPVNQYNDEVHETTINISTMVGREQQKTYNSEVLRGRILCDEIIGRVQYLFQQLGDSHNPALSDTYILAHSASVQSRLPIRLEEEEDIWRADIGLTIIWSYKI